jgi:hypothetical protein
MVAARTRIRSLVVPCLVLAVQAAAALHGPNAQAWEPDSAQRARLLARQVIVEATVDSSGAAGRARAAIWIAAPREQVYAWLTDCGKALTYVPHLTACRIVEAAPDQSWKIIAHEIDYSWFLPRTRYVFRASYQPPARVDFQEVSGDLVINQGSWILNPDNDGRGTLLAYEVRVKPRMYVPPWLVRRSLRKDLPELLMALRRISETGR